MGVRATGRHSLRHLTGCFLGMGTIVVDLRHAGTVPCCKDRLKMLVNTPASWSSHDVSVRPGTLSGPAALVMSILFTVALTCWHCKMNAGSSMGEAMGRYSLLHANKNQTKHYSVVDSVPMLNWNRSFNVFFSFTPQLNALNICSIPVATYTNRYPMNEGITFSAKVGSLPPQS